MSCPRRPLPFRAFLILLVCLGTWSVRVQAAGIHSFSPKSGPVGTAVTIEGSGFVNVAVIFGGGVQATGSYKKDEITAYVPEGAQSGPITVRSSSGNVSTSQDFIVTGPSYTPPPLAGPVITSALSAVGTQDQPFTYQITADREVARYAAMGLPRGLSLDEATGVISGTPVEAGTFLVGLSATNAEGTRGAGLEIQIATDDPVMTVSVSPPTITAADGRPAKFLFTLSHPSPRDVYLTFRTKGTAAKSFDYSFIGRKDVGPLKIQAGKTSATVKVVPLADPRPGTPTAVTLRLTLNGQYGNGFVVGDRTSAKIKIIKP